MDEGCRRSSQTGSSQASFGPGHNQRHASDGECANQRNDAESSWRSAQSRDTGAGLPRGHRGGAQSRGKPGRQDGTILSSPMTSV